MNRRPSDDCLASLARSLNVVDALLFRRVSPTCWAHLGGLGRGRGWAGIVEVDEAEDRLAVNIPSGPGGVHRLAADEPTRLLGPYYARGGAVVRTSNDVAVVLGNPHDELAAAAADEDALRRLADMVEAAAEDVLPSKRLADELEVLHAVRAVMSAPSLDLVETMRHIVHVAVDALSCDLGVLRDGSGRLVVVGPDDVPSEPSQWQPALDAMLDDTWCAQDASTAPSALVQLLPSLRSMLALPLPAPTGGVLLVIHTEDRPRGFTSLCRRLAAHVVEAGSVLAQAAALREDLRAAADHAAQVARTDSLTGLGNRLCWDEAVAAGQLRVDAGAPVSVLTVDIDGLKSVNDRYGHDAGDELLRRCADTLRRHCRPDDIAVRTGGDEFALLLPVGPELAQQRYRQLRADLGAATSGLDMVAASVGLGSAAPGQRLTDAVRDADAAMYAHKRARREQISLRAG